MTECVRPNCNRQGRDRARGLCQTHYDYFRRQRESVGGRLIGKIPAEPVVEHTKKLRQAGLGYRRIAELTGLTSHTIQRVGKHPYCYVDTAERILNIPVPHDAYAGLADGAKVPSVGTMRRLQALVAIGYSQRHLARELGAKETAVWKWTVGYQDWVFASTAKSVRDLFERLQTTPGGNVRAKNRARKEGWAAPLAWADDIDDPAAQPFTVGRELKREAFEAAYFDCVGLELSEKATAERLGVTVEVLRRRVARLAA